MSLSNQARSYSILLFGTQIATGGAQKVLLDQARWFGDHGWKTIAVFLYDKEGLRESWQKVSDFPIVNLQAYQPGRGVLFNVLKAFKGLISFWQLLRREKIDVIETFTHDSNLLILPIAWIARIPVRIATHHGMIEGFPRWRERLHALIVNLNIANILVAVSEKTRQIAIKEGVQADRICVIQNGIKPISVENVNRLQVRKEAGIEENEFFLLSVGRLVYQKAHEVLIAAMPSILKEFPNVKLGICGDGVLRPQLESQIKKLKLEDSIKLLGRWQNVAKFLVSADIFVLPSRWEGLPIALLEAMSVGLPIIATHVEGVDEVIIEGIHGILVPVEDPDKLAFAVLQLLRDPNMRARMGMASKQRLEELYSVDRMCEVYLQLILMLLNESRRY